MRREVEPNHKCKRARLYVMEGVEFSHEGEVDEKGDKNFKLEE